MALSERRLASSRGSCGPPNGCSFGTSHPDDAWAEFCHRFPIECQIDPSEPAAITLTLSIWEAMVAVNEHVNATIKALPDWQHGASRTGGPTRTMAGRREDLQLLKRKS
jgi:predicted transglutaminase-like cysteine proteinase